MSTMPTTGSTISSVAMGREQGMTRIPGDTTRCMIMNMQQGEKWEYQQYEDYEKNAKELQTEVEVHLVQTE